MTSRSSRGVRAGFPSSSKTSSCAWRSFPGKQVAVVKQPDASDSAEIESAILQQMPQAKTVVSVLSPPFARSNGCHRMVDTFWKSAQACRTLRDRQSHRGC